MDPAELTPTQLMARVEATVATFETARAAMAEQKSVEAALAYCHAKARMKGVRVGIPKPQLVETAP